MSRTRGEHRSLAPSDDERGAIALVVAGAITLLTVVALLVVQRGHAQVTRRQLRAAADSVALGLAAQLREIGLPNGTLPLGSFTPDLVRAHLDRKMQGSFTVDAEVLDEGKVDHATIRVTLTADYDPPFSIGGGHRRIVTVSYARIKQKVYGEKWPVVLLMVDASGPMGNTARDTNSNHSIYELLVQGIQGALQAALPARFALLAFNSDVRATVEPTAQGPVTNGEIMSALRGIRPDGGANIKRAFERADQMLENYRTVDRSAILFSDGYPSEGGTTVFGMGINNDISILGHDIATSSQTAAKRAAAQVRDHGASVFTIEMRPETNIDSFLTYGLMHLQGPGNPIPGPGLTQTMIDLAGGPNSDGEDHRFYSQVHDASDVESYVTSIARRACSFGPIQTVDANGAPSDDLRGPPLRVFAYRSTSAGDETSLQRQDDVSDHADDEAFEYLPTKSGVYVLASVESCSQLSRSGARLIVRYGEPWLVKQPL